MANRYRVHAVSTPAGMIRQVVDQSHDIGITPFIHKSDGMMSPQFFAVMEQKTKVGFSTTALNLAMTALGLGFYSFSSEVDVYLAAIASGGGIAGASAHGKLSGSHGVIVPRRLSCQQGQQATLQSDIFFISADGTTAPATFVSNASLPSAVVVQEAFTLGQASINGSALGEITSLDIDFGYKEMIESTSGNVYATFAAYQEFAPKVTVKTSDPSILSTIGVGGVVQGGTTSKFYFQKLASGGSRVAAATAAHIKLTVTAGFHYGQSLSAGDNSGSLDLISTPIDDGTGDIFVLSTASAIT